MIITHSTSITSTSTTTTGTTITVQLVEPASVVTLFEDCGVGQYVVVTVIAGSSDIIILLEF